VTKIPDDKTNERIESKLERS